MSTSEYFREAIQLFEDIASILNHVVSIECDHDGELIQNENKISEILLKIQSKTYNYNWRNDIAKKYNVAIDHEWSTRVRNESNAMIGRARETQDPIAMGNAYTRLGLYREAMVAYSQATNEHMELTSNLNILQCNWSIVCTTLGKQFLDWQIQDSKSKGQVHTKELMNDDLLLNLALAYWYLREFSNCLSVLLHLDPYNQAFAAKSNETGDESGSKKNSGIWLNYSSIRSMLFVCSYLSLNSDVLRHFENADPVARAFRISELIKPAKTLDLSSYWSTVNSLTFPSYEKNFSVIEELRDKICKDWIFVHNKIPIDTVMAELGRFRANYSENDFFVDLERWRVPYCADFVNNCLILRSREELESQSKADMHNTAKTLALEYKRDALVLIWNKRNGVDDYENNKSSNEMNLN